MPILICVGRTIGLGPISDRSSRYRVMSSTPRPIWQGPRDRSARAIRSARIFAAGADADDIQRSMAGKRGGDAINQGFDGPAHV